MRTPKRNGIFEAWGLPGHPLVFERITAGEMKPIDAFIVIGSSVRKFRIHHVENQGFHPWKLLENWPLGTDRPHDNWEPLDEFSSLKEARAEARRLALESRVK